MKNMSNRLTSHLGTAVVLAGLGYATVVFSGECFGTALDAARDAVSDVSSCTAGTGDQSECGSIVYEDRATGAYCHTTAIAGGEGYYPAGSEMYSVQQSGPALLAVHSHSNPDQNGYVLSPWDMEFSESHGVPVFLVADGSDKSCYSYYSADRGEGEGLCQ